uniref:PHP domain-containing protein n=1 Tax=Eiseniibacteriota bacterium TaxID=2212470 RepID=A0A832MJM1_UNCEI
MKPARGARGVRRVDLHTHTTFSDGALDPEALVALAVERGLAALAVTDHDSVEALPRARAAAPSTLEIVPGIEVSTTAAGLDLHVLGYYVDPEHAGLRARLERFRGERVARAEAILARLADLGHAVARDEVLALAGHGVVGRPHVAQALVRAGHVATVDEAFRRFLAPHGAAYVPRPAFRPEEAIALIHGAGGVSVLAHPGAALGDTLAERLVAAGLRGVEVWHPQHAAPAMRRWRAFAARFGLIATGGSDFHGPGRGAALGDLPVPWTALAGLKRAAGVAG